MWSEDDDDDDGSSQFEAERAVEPKADLSFTDHNLYCDMCGGGESKTPNMIVICDRCEKGFHQKCHRPQIPDYVVINEEAEWLCKTCAAKYTKNYAAEYKPRPPFTGPRLTHSSELPYSVRHLINISSVRYVHCCK